MSEHRPNKIVLPPSAQRPDGAIEVQDLSSLVVVGANGAGKTRLGAWIELNSEDYVFVHRVSAQKSLEFPVSSSTISMEHANAELHFGVRGWDAMVRDHFRSHYDKKLYKSMNRWLSKPATTMLDDVGSLLRWLFTEDYMVSQEYKKASSRSPAKVDPPASKLDRVNRIWEEVLPHRRLFVGECRIEASLTSSEGGDYSAAEMSDGERVVFYLIGQCLSAPRGAIIVIDEPELHLHRSIQPRLWDAIEAERPDCFFVYITHDLDFASTRLRAKKVWLKSFDGTSWEWQEIVGSDEIPEEMLLSLLGSRKPVLFTEGTKGSLDFFVYSSIYGNYTIQPCGGCEKVIQATRSFKSLNNLHSLNCLGIVDRDYRSNEDVSFLQELGIYVTSFSEIENVFLIEVVVRCVAEILLRGDEANQAFWSRPTPSARFAVR